jgi:hypothetical protein
MMLFQGKVLSADGSVGDIDTAGCAKADAKLHPPAYRCNNDNTVLSQNQHL